MKITIGTLVLFIVLLTTFLFSSSNVWAWGSNAYGSSSWGRSSGSYEYSNDKSSSTSDSSNDSSWGSSGTSRDGSTSWSSWSYSDNGSSLSEDYCRRCHSDLDRFVFLKYENPDKHHLLVDNTMPINSIAPIDTTGDLYECLTCHSVETVDNTFVMKVTRDCLKCHPINTVTGSPRSNNVHHRTKTYRSFSCNICHGVIGWGWGR